MNYLRGAISTISAPYQYYKDLPPINPSTLTGAIDVIVIERPAPNGGTELACSPFHVRFGKWQILRPGEKKVNVSVNGHPIPFNMKIGEAGEAFFVFETDDDIPEDLITSPLLEATQATTPAAHTNDNADRFGAKRDEETDGIPNSTDFEVSQELDQEPDFLDLDAAPKDSEKPTSDSTTPPPPDRPSSEPSASLPSPPPSPITASSLLARTGTKIEPTSKVDQLLKSQEGKIQAPEVSYHHDIALDAEGYHLDGPVQEAHSYEVSPDTQDTEYPVASGSGSRPPSPSRTPQSQQFTGKDETPKPPSATLSRPPKHKSISLLQLPQQGVYRATSEPPPDLDEQQQQDARDGTLGLPVQEYSWEWGGFPQPSPMKSSFGKGRFDTIKGKGKIRMDPLNSADDLESDGEDEEPVDASFRSQSVPPELDGSPTLARKELPDENGAADSSGHFGAGGRLSAKRGKPTEIRLYIEGKTTPFELSLVDDTSVFHGQDDLIAGDLFDKGKIDFRRFMEDENIVHDENLVINWAGGQYITRNDASPLMDALIGWRTSTLQSPPGNIPSRGPSPTPLSDEEPLSDSDEREPLHRAGSDPLDVTRKPTSSSWSRWWSRSRNNKDTEGSKKTTRPNIRETASDAAVVQGSKSEIIPIKQSSASPVPFPPASAPSSTPISTPLTRPQPTNGDIPSSAPEGKRFAKTLRLTSDQLKALNLKSGPNNITFSLSTTGVITCAARIFLWDSTDLVVVSDIDGTITKSDGLGHVFAMIGRDWTHIGVAKLYTDITRNGYKIMYLTSRAIGQADATRDYLKGIKQNDYQLPEGPVIMSPDRLIAALHREVIMRKPEVFKMACLRDIQRLFGEASRNPFYAGFGNRITDALSYRSVNVPSARIFTIDSAGEVKMELLELAGYKSSYIHMTDLVDQMFPPIHRKWAPEFTDFNYWKAPVQEFTLPDLSPPSPALSARSDTSNQSTLARIRNFSLVGNRPGNNLKQPGLSSPGRKTSATTETSTPNHHPANDDQSPQLRQMTSLERLSSTLAALTQSSSSSIGETRRSLSPGSRSSLSLTYAETSDDDYGDDGIGFGGERIGRRRERTKSVTSMPGSLDDLHFGHDEEGDDEGEEGHDGDEDLEEGYGYDGEGEEGAENEEEAAEEAFDEDFFATGEMKNVPFL